MYLGDFIRAVTEPFILRFVVITNFLSKFITYPVSLKYIMNYFRTF